MCFRETFFPALQQEDIYDLLRVSFPVQINRVIIKLCHRSSCVQSFHTETQLHILRTQPQLSTQTMNSMKLKNVVPLTLDFNEYAEATLDILGEEASMTPTKLLYIYTALKAFVVPLRSFRFISYNFLLVEVE